MKIAVHAVNVNTGGALVLLNEMLDVFSDKGFIIYLYISDKVNKKIYNEHLNVHLIPCSSFFKSLFFCDQYDLTIFFGNLPPLKKVNNSYLYIHNAYLTSKNKDINVDLKNSYKLKLLLMKIYIRLFINNVDNIICQTKTMKNKINNFYNKVAKTLPFYKKMALDSSIDKEYDFCFIGLPSYHKNHDRLLKAIELLSGRQLSFSIALTIPDLVENEKLIKKINHINNKSNIKIYNLGLLNIDEVNTLYNKSRALIFPSSIESYGLPLIEAAQHNLVIFAPNRTYVNDVIEGYYDLNIDDIYEMSNKIFNFIRSGSSYSSAKLKPHDDFISHIIKDIEK